VIKTNEEGEAYQEAIDREGYPFRIRERETEDEEGLKEAIREEVNGVFQLERDYPIRVTLYRSGNEGSTYISVVVHHIVFDGWSAEIFYRELTALYRYYLAGAHTEYPLSSLGIQYKDYAVWQRNYLTGERLERQINYWKERLLGYETLNLAVDKERPVQVKYDGDDLRFEFGEELSEAVHAAGRTLGVSVYTVLLSGYYLLLSTFSGQKDIVVGTVTANRQYSGIDETIGFFVNTLAMRQEIDSKADIRYFIAEVGKRTAEAQEHQDIPFEKLVEELSVEKDTSRSPIFQAVFSVQDSEAGSETGDIFTKAEGDIGEIYKAAKFDISLFLEDGKRSIGGVFNYALSLFNRGTIKEYAETYLQIMRQITGLRDKRIKEINALTKTTYRKIIHEWNRTEAEYPEGKTIVDLFEEQAERHPDNIAVVYGEVRMSYRELNEKANKLAWYLMEEYAIRPDDLIALYMDRSENVIIAILGVLKAGGAYVPVSPEYPDERAAYMFEDSGVKLVLANSIYCKRLTNLVKAHIEVESIDGGSLWIKAKPKKNPAAGSGPENLAYVIYTSGTTGKPKGVLIKHRGVVNLAIHQGKEFGLTAVSPKNCLWYANYVFDAHVSEVFTALCNAHTLFVLVEEQRTDIRLLGEYIKGNKISIGTIPPALLDKEEILELETIIVAGEISGQEVMEAYYRKGVRVINAYGPTEATVCASVHHFGECSNYNNIGKPIGNTSIYILDGELRPLPVGAVGELYLGGIGVARGYLNKPELTAEKFIGNPYQTGDEKRRGYNGIIYKTGDLARYLPDGNIEYLGRNDFQVKIRGFRIELGEIESALGGYEGIKSAVVVAKERGGLKYLAAYYVADREIDENALWEYLAGVLPEYMVPQAMMRLERLPLTVNGKLDRRALPEIELRDEAEYEGPENETERKLCDLFGQVLEMDSGKVSVTADFFRLGGSSIMAIKLANRIQKETEKPVRVADIFKYKTSRNLAEYIHSLQDDHPAIEAMTFSKAEDQVLSFAQSRLWFIENYEEGSNAYNVPMIQKLRDDVEIESLKEALYEIINRHEVLRSVIKTSEEGEAYQEAINRDLIPFVIKELSLQNKSELKAALKKDAEHIFALDSEYLIRITLLSLGNSEQYLCVVVHHVAFDGWSADIFYRELTTLYRYHLARTDKEYPLSPLGIQYKDYAAWQRKYLSGEVLERQINYWKERLSGYETLNLAVDKERPAQVRYEGDDLRFEFGEELSRAVHITARTLGVSAYTVLLSGYYLLLSTFSSQKDIIVGTVTANRQYQGIDEIIGFFVNTLVMRQEIDEEAVIRHFIAEVGKRAAEAQEHQDIPFEKLVEELSVEKDTSRSPIFQAAFSVQDSEEDNDATEDIFAKAEGDIGEIYKAAKFDLSLFLQDGKRSIGGVFNYALSLFNRRTIEGYAESYIQIMRQITGEQDKRIKEINFLTEIAYHKIIHVWNQMEAEYPADKTIVDLFEKQVRKTPDNTAVVYEGVRLSYRELNERANQLAWYLIETYEIKPDDIIALCLNRSEKMILAILAALKAGGAWAPISPEYPDERITYILKDTKAKVFLTNEVYAERIERIAPEEVSIKYIDSREFNKGLEQENTDNCKAVITTRNLAYVIYTSGTTGEPKGVMIEHRGIPNLVYALHRNHGFREAHEVVLFLVNYVFDASVEQLFLGLLRGHTVVVSRDGAWMDKQGFVEQLRRENVSYISMTPSLLGQMDLGAVETLKIVNSGGEALTEELLKEMSGKHFCFTNSYGPTEITVTSHANVGAMDTSIGKVIGNTTSYILDGNLRPLPVGAIGELYIGGVQVARGYLNKPELTAEKFIGNPFQTSDEKRRGYNGILYKTGDLVRYLPDGNIEYLGRNDFQVKIRGFRIELGEIESAVTAYEGIKSAVVAAKEKEGSKYLAAYYVAEGPVDEKALRGFLERTLPEYMVPRGYLCLESLPLTVNGKLDRRALPEIELSDEAEYEPPEGETEERLCALFGQVLGMDSGKVSASADFFRLGGDSIRSIQLVSRMQRIMHSTVSVKDLFAYRTIRKLAEKISGGTEQTMRSEQGILKGEFPLFPPAKFFLKKLGENPSRIKDYNRYITSYKTKVENFDPEVLQWSLELLVEHHDAFRLIFSRRSDGSFVQAYNDVMPQIKIHKLNIADFDADTRKEKTDREIVGLFDTFDIFRGPLFAFLAVYGFENKSADIYIFAHHITTDGVSMRIVGYDFITLYYHLLKEKGKLADKSSQDILGLKSTSCRQWINALGEYEVKAETERAYWENIIAAAGESNRVLKSLPSCEPAVHALKLDEDLTSRIMKLSRHGGETRIDDILLSALSVPLSNLTGGGENVVFMESHGRQEFMPDIDVTKTMGWFASPYPVKLPSAKDGINELIADVKEMRQKIPEEGMGFKALYLNERQDVELPAVYFNYQGEFESDTGTLGIEVEGKLIKIYPYVMELTGRVYKRRLEFDLLTQIESHQAALFLEDLKDSLYHVSKSLERPGTVNTRNSFLKHVVPSGGLSSV
jgi:amino acid adenylation domain-containing protein